MPKHKVTENEREFINRRILQCLLTFILLGHNNVENALLLAMQQNNNNNNKERESTVSIASSVEGV